MSDGFVVNIGTEKVGFIDLETALDYIESHMSLAKWCLIEKVDFIGIVTSETE